MKGEKEICIVLLLSVIVSAFLILSLSTALDNGFVDTQQSAIDRKSAVINQSHERAESLANRISLIKQKVALRQSENSAPILYELENNKQDVFNKSYPTGLIVTPYEFAENRKKIEASNSLLNVSGINASYPTSWDWRSKGGMTQVRDQSGCGACVAFAILASEESAWLINNSSRRYDLSEWYLFQKGKGSCSAGSQFERMLNAAKDPGTVTEECCPYLEATRCTSPLHRITSWKKVYSTSEAKEYISKKGPLMSGMSVYEDFFWIDNNNIYTQQWGSFVGYHAVCIVGYDDEEKCWIVKNSWSTSWGDEGYCRIAYSQCGIGTDFPFYTVEITPDSDPIPPPKKFSARVVSQPSGIYELGTTMPDDRWVLKTTNYGITGQIGTYPSNQQFKYKLKTTDGMIYYSDQKMNPDGLKYASVFELSGGRTWISWRGITRRHSSDVVIEVQQSDISNTDTS